MYVGGAVAEESCACRSIVLEIHRGKLAVVGKHMYRLSAAVYAQLACGREVAAGLYAVGVVSVVARVLVYQSQSAGAYRSERNLLPIRMSRFLSLIFNLAPGVAVEPVEVYVRGNVCAEFPLRVYVQTEVAGV